MKYDKYHTVYNTRPYYTIFIFFFSSRRRHTRFDCDWSSDVCSSDLLGEGFLIDDRAHEVAEVAHVADLDVLHHRNGAVAHLAPERLGHVHTAGRRALLPLVFEAAARDRDGDGSRVGRRVRDDEVLAAGFTNQPRIPAVFVDVLADLLPDAVEDDGAAREVDAGELARIEEDPGDLDRVAGNHVDDAGRHARLLEAAQRVVAAQHRRRGRLPHDGVAHQRRRGRQVAADGGEVERRDGVDETFERPVFHLVPHAGPAGWLLVEQFLGEPGVEPPEVDHLRRGVDLRLVGRLRLSEHGR